MKTSFVSTMAVQNAMRLSIQQGQTEIVKLQEEATTSIYADTGAALGSSTARVVNLKDELARLSNLRDTNALVTQRLSTSQLAVESMRSTAEELNTTLFTSMGVDDATRLASTTNAIQSTINAFFVAANTQSNGGYLLSGINSDARALTPYDENTAAKASFQAAFESFRDENNADPSKKPVTTYRDFTKEQMTDFLKTKIEPLYMGDPNGAPPTDKWKEDWSKASDINVSSRISASEVVTSTTNANQMGVRRVVMAGVIATELLGADLTSEARSVVNRVAQDYTQQGISGLINMASDLGTSEGRVTKANTLLDSQKDLLSTSVTDLEGVDPYEASTRMKALLTQIETSYTLTARIQQLSLINFL
jgi:flagellar hook-associated protein 3 FlgL